MVHGSVHTTGVESRLASHTHLLRHLNRHTEFIRQQSAPNPVFLLGKLLVLSLIREVSLEPGRLVKAE